MAETRDGKSSSSAGRGQALAPGRHWVSDANFAPEVTRDFEFPKPLGLIDSTLRKVIYTAGVRPSVAALLRIAEILAEIGVRDESLNLWFWGEAHPDELEWSLVRALGQENCGLRLNVFTDTLVGDGRVPASRMRETVDRLADVGVRIVNPGLVQAAGSEAFRRQADELAALSFRSTSSQASRSPSSRMASVSTLAILLSCMRMRPPTMTVSTSWPTAS